MESSFDVWFVPLIIVIAVVVVVYWHVMWFGEVIFSNLCGFLVKFRNDSKDIALTIDDAPYSFDSLKMILDVLKKHDCQATFFVISSQINEVNKPLLVRAVKEGHHLANHGKIDRKHVKLTRDELDYELKHCHDAILEIYKLVQKSPPSVKYYRPGCGQINKTIDQYARANNYKIVLGTNYPNDPYISWSTLNKWYILSHLRERDIIILHERMWTITLLDELLPAIKAKGHRVTALA